MSILLMPLSFVSCLSIMDSQDMQDMPNRLFPFYSEFSFQIGSIILDTFIHLLFPYCYNSKLIYLIGSITALNRTFPLATLSYALLIFSNGSISVITLYLLRHSLMPHKDTLYHFA